MLFNPIKTLCEWKQLRGNWMSHPICCPHATAMLIYSKWISLSSSFLLLTYMTVHLSIQSATGLERKAFLRWVMLFIKLYRNPVACMSGQSVSSSSIMISATPACCYLVMFGDFEPAHFSAALAHMVTVASENKNTNIWLVICYWNTTKPWVLWYGGVEIHDVINGQRRISLKPPFPVVTWLFELFTFAC